MTTHPHRGRRARERTRADCSDATLLLAVRAGDLAAYGELYHRYSGDARRYARSLAGADDVEDIVAEAFAKVLRAVKAGGGPVDRVAPYLMVAVRTTAATIHGRRARARALDRLVGATDTLVDAPDPLRADDRLAVAFRSLSPRWRQVIWWSVIDGMSATEIGERLDLKPTAASALSYRARRGLLEAYERTGPHGAVDAEAS